MTREEFIRQEIETYRRRIDVYQALILEWERELGSTGTRGTPGADTSDQNGKGKASPSGDPISLVQGMVFFNKSQPDAAKAFLQMVGYPLATGQILVGIEKGGVKVGGKNETVKKQNLYTILNRSGEFGRVARDTWGVIGWPGVTKGKTADEAEVAPTAPSGTEAESAEKGEKK